MSEPAISEATHVTHSRPLNPHSPLPSRIKMLASSVTRARLANSLVARRGFSTTRTQLGSPYHYAEGPHSNIPFNPKTRFFAVRYWSFMIVGFGTPFAIAVWQTKKTRA